MHEWVKRFDIKYVHILKYIQGIKIQRDRKKGFTHPEVLPLTEFLRNLLCMIQNQHQY